MQTPHARLSLPTAVGVARPEGAGPTIVGVLRPDGVCPTMVGVNCRGLLGSCGGVFSRGRSRSRQSKHRQGLAVRQR